MANFCVFLQTENGKKLVRGTADSFVDFTAKINKRFENEKVRSEGIYEEEEISKKKAKEE